jgi:hypothetical protein
MVASCVRWGLVAALAALLLGLLAVQTTSQPPPAAASHPYLPPRSYVCTRAAGPIAIDGKLDDAAWRDAPWTEDFVEGDVRPKPRYRTRARMLWDDTYFYVAAELEEPHVWATLTQRDAYIFTVDNDFEVFIDPDGDHHAYYELEMNALNTVWDLLLPKPYRDGGLALDAWEIAGLKSAVHVEGTLNDPSDTDRRWTLELAFPWKVLGQQTRAKAPPQEGDVWRVNFSRVQWQHELVDGKYRKVPGTKEDNWVWSPQGVIDMHRPELWGRVLFTRQSATRITMPPDATGPARHALMQVYHAQQAYRKEHGRWASDLEQLGLGKLTDPSLAGPIKLQTTDSLFEASVGVRLPDGRSETWRIRQDSLFWRDGE